MHRRRTFSGILQDNRTTCVALWFVVKSSLGMLHRVEARQLAVRLVVTAMYESCPSPRLWCTNNYCIQRSLRDATAGDYETTTIRLPIGVFVPAPKVAPPGL